MKKWNFEIRVTSCILLISLLVLSGVYIFYKKSENNTEKKVITGEAMWPTYFFSSAVDEAVTIVYGKVLNKSDTKVHQVAYTNGRSYNEYYKEASIEVIDMLKGNRNDATVTYLEFGGETEDVIYIFDDIEPVELDGEYIFFLNEYGAALSPMTLLRVDDTTVLTQGKIMPTPETSALSSDISVESYLRAIESALVD